MWASASSRRPLTMSRRLRGPGEVPHSRPRSPARRDRGQWLGSSQVATDGDIIDVRSRSRNIVLMWVSKLTGSVGISRAPFGYPTRRIARAPSVGHRPEVESGELRGTSGLLLGDRATLMPTLAQVPLASSPFRQDRGGAIPPSACWLKRHKNSAHGGRQTGGCFSGRR